jgi:hypothetical protein
MKKLLIALIVVGLLPAAALAQPPAGATEVDSWSYEYDEAAGAYFWDWQSGPGGPNVLAKARCFASGQADSACNKDWWIFFKVHASIAQWIEWDFSGTRWDWFVRKPGNYAANCMTWWISSNQEVTIDFHEFGPLVAVDPKIPDQDMEIEIYYCFDPPGGVPPLKTDPIWIPAPALNDEDNWFHIEDSYDFHYGTFFKFWNYIHVERCNSACEYQDDAWVTLTLECQKPWIDRSTGYFNF